MDELKNRVAVITGAARGLGRGMAEDGTNTRVDFVASTALGQDDEFADKEEAGIINSRVRVALTRLEPRERFIIEQRVMNEKPITLKELGEHFGFSRERARQLEIRAKDKVKNERAALMVEVDSEPLSAAV